MHKRDKKTAKKVLYKHINSGIPAPCLRLAGAGYNMQGLGQATEDKIVFGGKCGRCSFLVLSVEFLVVAGFLRLPQSLRSFAMTREVLRQRPIPQTASIQTCALCLQITQSPPYLHLFSRGFSKNTSVLRLSVVRRFCRYPG